MQKKQLLIVIESLGIGGAEKSLITLLSLLNYDKYDVDLQLWGDKGAFMRFIPKEVNVLPLTSWHQYLQKSLVKKLFYGNWKYFFSYVKMVIGRRRRWSHFREEETFVWKTGAVCIERNPKHYDIAIAYAQYTPTFYVSDKVNATQKVCYINVPFNVPQSLLTFHENAFNQMNTIVGVSNVVEETLLNCLPYLKPKVKVIKDPISKAFSERLAGAYEPQWHTDNQPKLVTAARLVKTQKGMDILLHTAKYLRDKGVNFHWYVLGEGSYGAYMKDFIDKNNLTNCLHLMGAVANPYPFIKKAMLYVQTSRFEGYGLSIAEARLLNTPVVTTAYKGWEEQMKPNLNGLVTDLVPNAVGDAIIKLLTQKEEINKITKYLEQETKGNPEEFDKFSRWILGEID